MQPGFAFSYAVAGSVLDQWLRTKPGGPPGTRTRDHRIKSPTDGLSSTTNAKRVQQTPTSNPLSFNMLIDSYFTGAVGSS